MDQNQIAHGAFTPEAATDEPASPLTPAPGQGESGILAFATAAEEAAYWAGVADGMHSEGRVPPPWLGTRGFAPEPEPAPAEPPADTLDFDPVPLRFRRDGWTPEKQREYVEALADTGVARQAAARVGMTEQSVNRLRRRPEARSFDRSCDGAMRVGAKRLVSIAYERAIEGTIKRHYYHGEVRSEERVYDGRLLIALLAKLGPLIMPDEESAEVARNWEPWMQAVEQGLPEPARPREPEPEREEAEVDEDEDEDEEFTFDGDEVWKDDSGIWWTRFPPSDGFDGWEVSVWGEEDYARTLSPAEQEAVEDEESGEEASKYDFECARRDAFFGFAVPEDEEEEEEEEEESADETEVSFPKRAEPYETSSQAVPEISRPDGGLMR
jgi:hypothetical protein